MTLLELVNIQFSYGAGQNEMPKDARGPEFEFNLELEPGNILAITGRSGSGKSTLLDLLAGFLQPTAGKILMDDCDITHKLPSDRQISILFQKNNLFEHLSVLDNICLGLSPAKKPNQVQKQQAIEMISQIGLQHYENRRADTLSGGQMQRVALARELLRQTKLILLDEPFNGLDEESRQTMVEILRQTVLDRECSVILVTHDLSSVETIIDDVVEIRDGKIQAGNA